MVRLEVIADEICPMDIKRRKGSFKVSIDMILKPSTDLFKFMSNFLIIRAESVITSDCIHYEAFSYLFDPLDAGCFAPEYDFKITREIGGSLTIKAIRLGNKDEKIRMTRRIDVAP